MMLLDEARKQVITPANVWKVSRRANLRLQLAITGETHAALTELAGEARKALTKHAGADGTLDGLGMYRAQRDLESLWANFFKTWKARFLELQRAAAAVVFGAWAVQHNEWFLPKLRAIQKEESRPIPRIRALEETDGTLDYVFNPQLGAVVNAAQQGIYDDGLTLSPRLWKLDQDSLTGIKQVLYQGIVNGNSAWDIAKELEQFLGADARCPRWTRTRLASLTKADIGAGDPRGLLSNSPNSISDSPCDGVTGIAYNALRLARNEINAAHALATDYLFGKLPWIEKEEVRLSPDHALKDECDAVAGEHPKGTVILPIHVHCLCYKVAVLMKPDEFAKDLRGWMRGERRWDAMDAYAASVGGDVSREMAGGLFNELFGWAFGGAK